MILLYSLKTEVLLKSSLFKFIKGQGSSFYLTDIQVYEKGKAASFWGEVRNSEHTRATTSPGKPKIRPSSSPEKMKKIEKVEEKVRDDPNKSDKSGFLLLSK